MCGDPTLLLEPLPTFEVLDETAAMTELGGAWENLLHDAGCRSPYLALGWLGAWSHGFGDHRLRFHVVRSGDRLVAALPLLEGRRTLAGLPVHALYSPSLNIAFSDLLVAGGRPSIDSLLDGLLATSHAHALLLRGVPRASREEGYLRDYLASRRLRHTVLPVAEVGIDTSGGLEAYRAGRRPKFWSNVRNRLRRLQAQGRVTFERHHPVADPAAVLAELCSVSMRSWKFGEGSAICLLEQFQRFFEALLATPMADVWLLRLDGEAIAYRVLAGARDVVAEVDIAFDEAHRALSPGVLLAAESNEAVIREGAREVTLGQDYPWKAEWSPMRRELLEFVIFLPGAYPALVARLHGRRVRRAGGEARC